MSLKRSTSMSVLAGLALGFTSFAAAQRDAFFEPGKSRVLIISGRNNHEWRSSTPFLREILVKAGLFDVRVNEEPAGMTPETLSPYDLLILDYQGPRLGKVAEAALLSAVEEGCGLVIFHGASYAFSGLDVLGDGHVSTGLREEPWREFPLLAGGVWSEENPKTGHGRRHSFRVRFTAPDHPVAMGMGEGFVATDELYHDLRMHPEASIIATAFSDRATGGTGEDEPVLWSVHYGKGRVFHTTLGHDLVAMSEPGFISTFARGCEWAATGRVTLPPALELNATRSDAPRVLVVTGGHDYDPDFYSVFDGDWLAWTHAASNQAAFSRDLRDRYEVALLYDMSSELDDTGRRNLRDFVESGKGVVVVHHALADYQDWEWWWRDVVGGRYILQAGAEPASTYQHDVMLRVTSVADHPITRGLGPFRLVDESYKHMWISPGITVLMETDAPTSDPPVVWVSPYQASRVVCIQLGHDRRAHRNPGFRELIRRSILWTAGKLK